MMKEATLCAAAALAAWLGAGPALADNNYPDKPVRIIVPLTPGGGTDTVARGLAQRLSAMWGKNVFIENKPGSGTIVGAEAAARSAPDGYTLFFTEPATFVINPHLYAKLPYDPIADFAPITVVCRLSPALALTNAVPAKNIAELIAWGKANPGKLSYGSFGSGSYPHVAMEHFKHLSGIDILHVPYKGSAGAIPAIISGELSMILINISVFEAHEKAGRLKIIGAATEKRLQMHPNLPTIAETVPGFAINVWFGLAAPARTPPEILDKVHAGVVKVLAEPEFREKFLLPQSYEPSGISRQEFAAQMKRELAMWGTLVRQSGAKAE
jgi:tripartite-type tricarboxylate transporter receptor subunit TctC